jgi:tetratricopeptide (TPR) repeat protein
MKIHYLPFACLLLFGVATEYAAGRDPLKGREAGAEISSVHSILREASELGLKQGEQERYWTQRVLLQIADQQTRAGDFDGALLSLRGSIDYDRGLSSLVKAMARAGMKDRALAVSRSVERRGQRRDRLPDVVQLGWVEHLVAKGDFKQASEAIEQIKSPTERHEALRKLAVAWSRSGDAAQAAKYFTQAIETATTIKGDFERARAFWETADAQRLAGFVDQAKATTRRLADDAEIKDTWARVAALRECAVLAARLKDIETAQSFFARAIKSRQAVPEVSKLGALELIATAQARAGLLDDARKTAFMMTRSEREHALYAIAVAQIDKGDADAAVATALSVMDSGQYRDDALNRVVAFYIGKRGFNAAHATANKVANPSRKATALLRVAAAQARAGDRKAAADTAAQIKLTHRPWLLSKLQRTEDKGFDYQHPQSWGENYDVDLDGFTLGSAMASVQTTAELASAAMELAQALDYKPVRSYADLFNDINVEVIESLGRAHAVFGDPKEAASWAKKIGSGDKVPQKDSADASALVRRRIYALLGVAEGMLDRSKE